MSATQARTAAESHVEHRVVEPARVGRHAAERFRGSFERGGADVGDHDSRAGRGEPRRRLAAEAAGPAGNQGDLAVKAIKAVGHFVLLLRGRAQ
jgi:hypothetical protein